MLRKWSSVRLGCLDFLFMGDCLLLHLLLLHHPWSCSQQALCLCSPIYSAFQRPGAWEVNVECQYFLVFLLTLTSYWLLVRTANHS